MVCSYDVPQVEQLFSSSSLASTQLLLRLETDMLLGLAVQQLTASIPDSYPGAQAARDTACQFQCSGLLTLWNKAPAGCLHMLPLPAAYVGPQLAIQVTLSPLGPPRPPASQLWKPEPQQQPQW
jgi:hypothetical protein